MKLTIIKANPNVILLEHSLTEEMLDYVSEEAKTLKEGNKPVFKVERSTNGGSTLEKYGATLGSSPVAFLDTNDVETIKMDLAKILEKLNKVEEQIIIEYSDLKDLAEKIKVKE